MDRSQQKMIFWISIALGISLVFLKGPIARWQTDGLLKKMHATTNMGKFKKYCMKLKDSPALIHFAKTTDEWGKKRTLVDCIDDPELLQDLATESGAYDVNMAATTKYRIIMAGIAPDKIKDTIHWENHGGTSLAAAADPSLEASGFYKEVIAHEENMIDQMVETKQPHAEPKEPLRPPEPEVKRTLPKIVKSYAPRFPQTSRVMLTGDEKFLFGLDITDAGTVENVYIRGIPENGNVLSFELKRILYQWKFEQGKQGRYEVAIRLTNEGNDVNMELHR